MEFQPLPHEKYPEKCPWDLGPNQNQSNDPEWVLFNGTESVQFSKDSDDGNWFNLLYNGELNERILAYKARLTYQKLLDKGYKLRK